MTIAIVAAMPEELAPLRARLLGATRSQSGALVIERGRLGGHDVALAASGDGARNARAGVAALLAAPRARGRWWSWASRGRSARRWPRRIWSSRAASPTRMALAHDADAARVEATTRATGGRAAVILSARKIVDTAEEKRRLAAQVGDGLAVVDLESASYVAAAEAAGIPWIVLRAVSDTADETLPPLLNRSLDAGGAVSRGRVLRGPHRRSRRAAARCWRCASGSAVAPRCWRARRRRRCRPARRCEGRVRRRRTDPRRARRARGREVHAARAVPEPQDGPGAQDDRLRSPLRARRRGLPLRQGGGALSRSALRVRRVRDRPQPPDGEARARRRAGRRSRRPRADGRLAAGGPAGRKAAGAHAGPGAGLLLQLGDGGGRGGHQALPPGDPARQAGLLRPRLPRPDDGRAVAQRRRHLPRGFRPAPGRRRARPLERSAGARSGARRRRRRGLHRRADPGQGGQPPGARLPRGGGAPLPPAGDTVRGGRGADRSRAHRNLPGDAGGERRSGSGARGQGALGGLRAGRRRRRQEVDLRQDVRPDGPRRRARLDVRQEQPGDGGRAWPRCRCSTTRS